MIWFDLKKRRQLRDEQEKQEKISTFYPAKHVQKMSPGKFPTSHSHIEQWKLSGKFPETIRMNYAIYFLYSGSHSFLQETGYIIFYKNHYHKNQQPDKQQT